MPLAHTFRCHPNRAILLLAFTFTTLLIPAHAQTNGQFSGSARCVISVDGAYHQNDELVGRYTWNETQTWGINGPPRLDGIYYRYPATWRVVVSGTKTFSSGSTSAITTFAADHSMPVELQVFNRASDNHLVISRNGRLPQQTVVSVVTNSTVNGVPQPQHQWLGGVWEYLFPTAAVPPGTTTVTGSNTTGWVVGLGSYGIQQPAEVPAKVDCQWQFTSAPAGCTYSINPTSYQDSGAGGTSSFAITASSPTCQWNAASQSPFLSVTAGSSGTGSGNVSFTVQPNPSTQARTATITAANQTFTINQSGMPAASCSYTVSPAGFQVPPGGGNLSVLVTASQPNCAWTATTDSNFVSILSGSSGTGSQTVSLAVSLNASPQARGAVVTIGGQTVSISQAAASSSTCTFGLDSTSLSFPSAGSPGSLQLTASASSCAWTVSVAESWVILTSSPSGTGSAGVSFQVLANPSSGSRTALMTVGGQQLSIQQAGGYSVGTGLRFVPLPPCRVMETRALYNFEGRTGAFGPPTINAGETRTLNLPVSNVCSIPANAKAYVVNVTVIPTNGVNFVTLWPSGEARPNVWSIRSPDGQVVANSAIVKAGTGGGISVYTSDKTDLLIDIGGYYTDNTNGLAYYPLTPCRVIDTRAQYRSPAGPFGPPSMAARQTRKFTFPATPYCTVPRAAAYSMTITVVPPAPLAYLTAWPDGSAQPNVSSINSFAGRVLANSVIVPAASDGSIDVFAYDATDFIVDINGYYAPDDGQTGLFYYPVSQCRANDSNVSGGIYADDTARTINIPVSGCTGIPANAKGYAINVTALPGGNQMPFLTAWPTGSSRPNASILNAFQGQIVTNSAIVPAGTNGAIDVYAFRRTHVVVEVSGYFGR